MSARAPSVTWGYAALVVAFLAIAALRLPYGEGLRYPTLLFERNAAQTLAGLVPGGLPQLDLPRLKRSVARIATVRLLRETGNSLRIAGGQVLDWVVWGGRDPLLLFPSMELWISAGLDEGVRAELDKLADIAAGYRSRLESEGWQLVVVPVPTKVGVHRELARWPIGERDLVTRYEIAADRSDEVNAYLSEALRRRGVPAPALQALYRAELAQRPKILLYSPGESHWSGEGIRIAAVGTAREIARVTPLQARTPVDPTYFPIHRIADLAHAFDPLSWFTSRLTPVWDYHDEAVNGEKGRGGYAPPRRAEGLVVVAGTSYSGHLQVTGQPIDFGSQLGFHLRDVEVQSRPEAGRGSFRAFESFWEKRAEIARDFAARHGAALPKVVVWEFPMRDLRDIKLAPPLR